MTSLAERFVAEGLLSEKKARTAQMEALAAHLHLLDYLAENHILSGPDVVAVGASEFGLPQFDLSCLNVSAIPRDLVKDDLLRKHQALPLMLQDGSLLVAIANPVGHGLNEIKFQTGLQIEPILVERTGLLAMLEQFLAEGTDDSLGAMDESLEAVGLEMVQQEEQDTGHSMGGNDDAPVVRFVNKMLLEAVKQRASDVHFEPYERNYRVRFRIDGLLRAVSTPPVRLANRIAARLKVMSQMDISERRKPQDGRIRMRLPTARTLDFRVNSLPALWGEKIVLRILDSEGSRLDIGQLGLSKRQLQLYTSALGRPQGMILITGPTGSGKTVSLYAGLGLINHENVNISTVEDPVEINLEGINQVNIRPKVGMNFAVTIRSLLRQDPDVIMIGEIRDAETAEIAVKAAQTGHLVLATLHTNSAAETLTRLRSLGISTFDIATSISLIIAQRLVRKLCPKCKIPLKSTDLEAFVAMYRIPEEIIKHSFQAAGCGHCVAGYQGRLGIYEFLEMRSRIARLVLAGSDAIQIAEQAKAEGFQNIWNAALEAIAAGLISLEETLRAVHPE